MSRSALLLVVALGALRDPCDRGEVSAGFNAPCTRSTDCAGGLSCEQGMCTSADGGVFDGGGGDENGSDVGVTDGAEAP